MVKKEKIWWIDGLKLLASLFVFWSHIDGLLGMKSLHIPLLSNWDSPVNLIVVLLNGNLWVFVFCMLSGYFIGQKKIQNVKVLASSVLNRYIRFLFPFLFTAIIIFLLSVMPGFRSVQVGALYDNDWVATLLPENIGVMDYLKYIFLMDERINPFIWTIGPIFVGNIFTYVANFVTRKWDENKRFVAYVVLFVVLSLVFVVTKSRLIYSTACFLGALLPTIFTYTKRVKAPVYAVGLIAVLLLVRNHNRLVGMVLHVVSLPGSQDYYFLNSCWNFVYAFLVLVCLNNLTGMQRVLGSSLFRKISALSLPIYYLHCPILLSVILLIFEWLVPYDLQAGLTAIIFLTATALVLFASWVYSKTLGKLSDSLSTKAKKWIDKKVLHLQTQR